MIWIVLAVVLFALLVLALAARPVLVRLPALRQAVLALAERQAQAEELARRAQGLQERAEVLRRRGEETATRLAAVRAGRGR